MDWHWINFQDNCNHMHTYYVAIEQSFFKLCMTCNYVYLASYSVFLHSHDHYSITTKASFHAHNSRMLLASMLISITAASSNWYTIMIRLHIKVLSRRPSMSIWDPAWTDMIYTCSSLFFMTVCTYVRIATWHEALNSWASCNSSYQGTCSLRWQDIIQWGIPYPKSWGCG